MNKFNNFQDLQRYLDHLGLFRMRLGLERMQKGMYLLDVRHGELPAVQLIGTNGKGSTASFLESLALAHGMKAGLFTSPHLVSVKERIRVDGKVLPDEVWLDAANKVHSACADLGLTYFEFLTLMAVLIFRQAGVDAAIMEAGLGGRYDATSSLGAKLHVITSIDLDHTPVLGTTVPEIAADKVAAVCKDSRVILARQRNSLVRDIVQQACARAGAGFLCVDDFQLKDGGKSGLKGLTSVVIDQQDLGLFGDYQLQNALTALLAWRILAGMKEKKVEPEKCLQALKNTYLPGRMHVVSPRPMIIMDGAHNPGALSGLLAFLQSRNINPLNIVFACLSDKEVKPMAQMIKKFKARRILVPETGHHSRAINRKELLALLGKRARPVDDLQGFLSGKDLDEPVLVCGSLYLLGYIYSIFPQWLDPDNKWPLAFDRQ